MQAPRTSGLASMVPPWRVSRVSTVVACSTSAGSTPSSALARSRAARDLAATWLPSPARTQQQSCLSATPQQQKQRAFGLERQLAEPQHCCAHVANSGHLVGLRCTR